MRIIGSGYDGDLNLTSVTVEEDGREYRFESPRWISVEKRLPGSDCDWVLAIGKFVPENTYGKPIISELRKDGKWWGDINDEFPLEDMGIRITHWMPLPEPPKEE